MKINDKVRVVYLPENVTDDVRQYLGAIGTIVTYSDKRNGSHRGWYVSFANRLPTKRFYENELSIVTD